MFFLVWLFFYRIFYLIDSSVTAVRQYLMPFIIFFTHKFQIFFFLIKRARMEFCCFDLLSVLSERLDRLTYSECIFSFPWMTKLFCPGTDLVSGIQGSRWGPGFLQGWTKLSVIPGALLLERNESELFVWWFFRTLYPRLSWERGSLSQARWWICSLRSRSIEVPSKLCELWNPDESI